MKDIDPFGDYEIVEQVDGLDSFVEIGGLATQLVAMISVAVVQTRNHYPIFVR